MAFVKKLHGNTALRHRWEKTTKGKAMVAIKGIRWNNKHQVAQRAVDNTLQLLQFFDEDEDNIFDETNQLTSIDLKHLKHMCTVTQLFLNATRRMERRGPTGSEVVLEWKRLEDSLQIKLQEYNSFPDLKHAISEALIKTRSYLQSSLACDPILVCTSESSVCSDQSWFLIC